MPFHWRVCEGGIVGQVAVLCGNRHNSLAIVLLVLLVVLLSACSRGMLSEKTGAEDAEPAYTCSDIEVDTIIRRELQRDGQFDHLYTPVSSLPPHLMSIAAKIVKVTKGGRLSATHCKIVSPQTIYFKKWFTRVEHPIHYIVELNKRDTNRVSEICVTRNRYAIDSGITRQDQERWEKEKQESGMGDFFSYPSSTRACFSTRDLTGKSQRR